MAYLRYLYSLVKYRHPRLSYFDNVPAASTRPIVKHNAAIVYSILAAFALIEYRLYARAWKVQERQIQLLSR